MQSQTDAPRRIALIIGTSTYEDSTLAHLRAPGTDAHDLAEVLSDSQIGKFDVHTFLDAPHDRLMRGVLEVCASVGPSDLILVYLSCHGVLDDKGRLYYATTNTERRLLAATSLAAAWLNDQLEDCRARSQILVLDCCHSGAFAKGAKGDEALALQEKFPGRGKVVLTASRATEYSFEGTETVGNGVRSVFTKAIVDGLKTGAADVNGDGDVTVADLYQYVFNKVRQEESRQTPMIWAYGSEGDLLVARSVRKREIRPAPLPAGIVVAIESSLPRVRAGGVAELADLLNSGAPELALAAENTLRRMAENEVPSVAKLARDALDSAQDKTLHAAADGSETTPEVSAGGLEPPQVGPVGSSIPAGGRSKPGGAVRLGAAMFGAVIGSAFTLAFAVGGIVKLGSNFGDAILWLAFGGVLAWLTWLVVKYGRTVSRYEDMAEIPGGERGEERQEGQ